MDLRATDLFFKPSRGECHATYRYDNISTMLMAIFKLTFEHLSNRFQHK